MEETFNVVKSVVGEDIFFANCFFIDSILARYSLFSLKQYLAIKYNVSSN